MMKRTTIQLREETKRKLERLKIHPRQSYEEVILKLLEVYEEWEKSRR
jgi:predicted CopG family antitoxin